jgi:hypothetical protein
MAGIEMLAGTIREDMVMRLPRQNKKQREGLSLLVATMLDVRSANLMDLAASLPRSPDRLDMRYQWISRLLGNDLIEVDAVMAPYGRDVLARVCANGQRVVLIVDQTQLTARHQAVMVALRIGGRALPLSWRIKETKGAIGFAEQRAALEAVLPLLPEGAEPVLMGDRFYGSPAVIAWCRDHGWDWRLRLKQDLLVFEDGGETVLAECFARGAHMLTRIELTFEAGCHQRRHGSRGGPPGTLDHRAVRSPHRASGLRLRAAVGHRAHVLRLQDPGLRHQGQPHPTHRPLGPPHPGHGAGAILGRVRRHVGCGQQGYPGRKKTREKQPRNLLRSLTSLFKRGIRRIQTCLQRLIPLPPLWDVWRN